MMIKRVAPGAQDFGCRAVEQIKMGRAGLLGNDLQELVKRAGHQFADSMRDIVLQPGEVPIHLIALGAYERYGFNRNGDGFKQAACEKFHHTFVTKPLTKQGAYWYRNHQNKDPQKSYGTVKMSVYNPVMHRIELLVALNATKEAADRNGGLIADKELEKVARGDEDWGVSMACRVPYDVCSGCGNRARNRSEYCTELTCKYGGCMNNLTKAAEDGHVLGVYNDEPTWFDISDVHRPADRIAWVMGHMKAASGTVIGGAQMAEAFGLVLPPHLRYEGVDVRTARLIKLAYEMADLEREFESGRSGRTLDEVGLPTLALAPRGHFHPQMWNALAGEKIALSIANWMNFGPPPQTGVLTKQASVRDVGPCLPGVFGRMVADGDTLEQNLADRTCDPSQAIASEEWRLWARKQASGLSLDPRYFETRKVSQIVARGACNPPVREKRAAHDPQAEVLARRYAVYQLHLLNEWERDPGLPRLKDMLVRQNYLA